MRFAYFSMLHARGRSPRHNVTGHNCRNRRRSNARKNVYMQIKSFPFIIRASNWQNKGRATKGYPHHVAHQVRRSQFFTIFSRLIFSTTTKIIEIFYCRNKLEFFTLNHEYAMFDSRLTEYSANAQNGAFHFQLFRSCEQTKSCKWWKMSIFMFFFCCSYTRA